jgi:hypothetical protein
MSRAPRSDEPAFTSATTVPPRLPGNYCFAAKKVTPFSQRRYLPLESMLYVLGSDTTRGQPSRSKGKKFMTFNRFGPDVIFVYTLIILILLEFSSNARNLRFMVVLFTCLMAMVTEYQKLVLLGCLYVRGTSLMCQMYFRSPLQRRLVY